MTGVAGTGMIMKKMKKKKVELEVKNGELGPAEKKNWEWESALSPFHLS